MATKKVKVEEKSLIERVTDLVKDGMDNDIPKEIAFHTAILIEMQVLENRVNALEGKN